MRNRVLVLLASLPLFIALAACGTKSAQQPAKPAPLSLTTCSDKHQSSLGAHLKQSAKGTVVYADLWADAEKKGDQALFEQKPDRRTWVIATDAPYGTSKSGTCTVKLQVVDADKNTIEVLRLDGTKVGRDHNRKIAADELVVRLGKDLNIKSRDFE